MKSIYLALFVILLSGCGIVSPGFIREDAQSVEARTDNSSVVGVDGPTGGHFNEDGEWVPDNADIPMTYKIPDIGAGFIFDVNSLDVSPSLQVEILEINTQLDYVGTLKLDAGVAYQRAFVYLGKLWTNIFEISTGIFVGWNFEDKDLSYGVGATIIRF